MHHCKPREQGCLSTQRQQLVASTSGRPHCYTRRHHLQQQGLPILVLCMLWRPLQSWKAFAMQALDYCATQAEAR
eukprot:3569884-Prorocentrum_lima.AAC.1